MQNSFRLRLEICVHLFVLNLPPATQLLQSTPPDVYNHVCESMQNCFRSSLSSLARFPPDDNRAFLSQRACPHVAAPGGKIATRRKG